MSKAAKSSTAYDVARAAGVSQATVSYILSGRRNGEARISDETRARVLEAVAALGYVPNHTARSLRRQRTERICVVLPNFGAPSHDLMVRDVQRAADNHNYTVIVVVASTDERERQVLDQLRRRLADGAIFVGPSHITAADLTALAGANLAVVAYSNRLAGPAFDSVWSRDTDACRAAVAYLVEHGHRRTAFLGHCADEGAREERFEGYRRALDERGIPINEWLNRGRGNSREEAYRNTAALLQLDERPTAIFAASDLAAISAIWAIRDAGLEVPADVAVIGVGNIPEGALMQPPLSTVGPATLEFSFLSDLLFSRLAGAAPAEGRIYHQDTMLIRRASA